MAWLAGARWAASARKKKKASLANAAFPAQANCFPCKACWADAATCRGTTHVSRAAWSRPSRDGRAGVALAGWPSRAGHGGYGGAHQRRRFRTSVTTPIQHPHRLPVPCVQPNTPAPDASASRCERQAPGSRAALCHGEACACL